MHNAQLVKKLIKHERSQRWLARKMKVSAMAVCKWCKGDLKIPKVRGMQIHKWLP